jgi:hypothetical protein
VAAARAQGANAFSYASETEARARLTDLADSAVQAYWADHVYMFSGVLIEILDDGKLWNHSETPCTGLPPAGDIYDFDSSYAIRDIRAGEEFLDDYGTYRSRLVSLFPYVFVYVIL